MIRTFGYFGYLVPEGYDPEEWCQAVTPIIRARMEGVHPYFITEPWTILNDPNDRIFELDGKLEAI